MSPRILLLSLLLSGSLMVGPAQAHPLGNFTVNHFTRLEPDRNEIRLRHVVDLAEIPTLKELSRKGWAPGSGREPSYAELEQYATDELEPTGRGLALEVDGRPVPIPGRTARAVLQEGQGGLKTLRLEYDLVAPLTGRPDQARQVLLTDRLQQERLGWREIVVRPAPGISVWDSTAFGSGLTDELRTYPEGMLTAPLNERTAEFSFRVGGGPAGATVLRDRENRPVESHHDALAELISRRELSPWVAFLGILLAFAWGAGHAFSPGHGKTVVGAYLVGSRGTVRHALFLGLTVTITHTSSVFALGLITLFASQTFVPEKVYPVLSLTAGLLVLGMGTVLFQQRLRTLLRTTPTGATGELDHGHSHGALPGHAHSHDAVHTHDQAHSYGHTHAHDHAHSQGHTHAHDQAHSHDQTPGHDPGRHPTPPQAQSRPEPAAVIGQFDSAGSGTGGACPVGATEPAHLQPVSDYPLDAAAGNPVEGAAAGELWHSHGGAGHSHLPPGAEGEPVTWKNLLALGISGGLLPCPSALLVLLGAVSLHRVAYGLVLVVAFSLGLAATLTLIGILFVYAGHLLKDRTRMLGPLQRILPVVSSLLITAVGAGMCWTALKEAAWIR